MTPEKVSYTFWAYGWGVSVDRINGDVHIGNERGNGIIYRKESQDVTIQFVEPMTVEEFLAVAKRLEYQYDLDQLNEQNEKTTIQGKPPV